MWFEDLVGFREESPQQVRENVKIEGNKMISLANGRSFQYGKLEIPTLASLRDTETNWSGAEQTLTVKEVIGNVQDFHIMPENKGALFQAASQFNLLEMVHPGVTPESGIGQYEYDLTQGPACAIACGAGTIFRNYFAEVNGSPGQTADNQIDCLDELAEALENEKYQLWTMKNGYALASRSGLDHISSRLANISTEHREMLKGKLKVGIQWDTSTTITSHSQEVTQVYCSALPVAYSEHQDNMWESFARLILEATYEATLYVALKNFNKTGNNRVYLTLVGGGAFGNRSSWIFDAMQQAFRKFQNVPLDIRIVSYGRSYPALKQFLDSL